MNPIHPRRRWFWLVLGLAAFASLEVLSLTALFILREARGISYRPLRMSLSERHIEQVQKIVNDEPTYLRHDPLLGWSITKNGSFGLYRSNSDGIRATQEYQLAPPDGVVRIASFGDSFTHGDDVSNEHTWQEFLAAGQSGLEVMNFGVGGFGLDQAYLRYRRDGSRYAPHVVLIGFMSENINRNVSVFRPFYFSGTGIPMAKPRFVMRDGGLVLKPNLFQDRSDYESLIRDPKETLVELGKHDWHFQLKPKVSAFDILGSVRFMRLAGYEVTKKLSPQIFDGEQSSYNEHSDAFRLTLEIFAQFHEDVVNRGALPIILLFPNQDDLRRYRSSGLSVFTPMVSYFREAGYRFVDLHEAFETHAAELSLDDLFDGHYSPHGNNVVADYLASYLNATPIARRD